MQHIQYVAGGYLKTVTFERKGEYVVGFGGIVKERQYIESEIKVAKIDHEDIELIHRSAIWNDLQIGDFMYDYRGAYWHRVTGFRDRDGERNIVIADCFKWDPAIERPYGSWFARSEFKMTVSVIVRPADSSDDPHDIVRRLPQRVNSGGYLSVQTWLESYGVNVIGEL